MDAREVTDWAFAVLVWLLVVMLAAFVVGWLKWGYDLFFGDKN